VHDIPKAETETPEGLSGTDAAMISGPSKALVPAEGNLEALSELKCRAVRGSMIGVSTQAVKFLVRMGSMMVLARLLSPEDFGLVGMVTAITGVLGIMKDAGLSMVTVQRAHISDDQTSTLFWINLLVGVVLGIICLASAPILVFFYREPRLLWVTIALASGFLFSGATAQHQALLQRRLCFGALAVIEIISLVLSTAVGIAMAWWGCRHWALVGMAVSLSAASTVGAWVGAGWIPGKPKRGVGIISMLHFGGTVTLNNFIIYVAYNAEKILLGRYWGAEALGIYGRAYQLATLPTDVVNSAIGGVAFPALSKLQSDPSSLRRYFLRGYALLLAMTVPMTVGFALFSEDLILTFLGPKWESAAKIFRYFAPTVFALSMINPIGWLLNATGRVGRSLKMALVITPLVIASYSLGLRFGPSGVAAAYSAMMTILIVPMIAWGSNGSGVTTMDMLRVAVPPFASGIVAGLLAFGCQVRLGSGMPMPIRLAAEVSVFASAYGTMLLVVMKQGRVYLRLLRMSGSDTPTGSTVSTEGA
jgi:O-antigen/teichoic acid export membrane protein